eukprot:14793957-Alexandrium_andersonii.AAC.2
MGGYGCCGEACGVFGTAALRLALLSFSRRIPRSEHLSDSPGGLVLCAEIPGLGRLLPQGALCGWWVCEREHADIVGGPSFAVEAVAHSADHFGIVGAHTWGNQWPGSKGCNNVAG